MNQTSRAPGAAVGKTEIRQTTCYMCACRCGINVHMAEGKVHYIEGNQDHPINKGVLCAKGSAGIMQHYSPARLKKPLLRTGERGSGEFREIEWDEALELATGWLGEVRRTDPRKLAFFTGPRPEPVNDRLVGASVRYAELCGPWRVLLGQHGSRRHLHDGRRLLGVRRAGLGEHRAVHDFRRGRRS
jgi:anaerobic selenocysteine-containing dehydrogenase